MGASFAIHLLFLPWFFVITFSLCFFKVESNVSCCEKEKNALLSLKQGLTDPYNWSSLSSWSDQEDCCRWDGVHCDNKTTQVAKLSIKHVGGKISPSLVELEFLNYLDLSDSFFNCTSIPSFLGSMVNLTHIDLHHAQICRHIPHQLGNLSSVLYQNLITIMAFMLITFIGCFICLPCNTLI